MKVLSTGQSVKSTGQMNRSSTGTDEENGNRDANPHVSPMSNPNAHLKGAAKIEYREHVVGDGMPEGVPGPGNMMCGNDAACEKIVKHPNRMNDPAMR